MKTVLFASLAIAIIPSLGLAQTMPQIEIRKAITGPFIGAEVGAFKLNDFDLSSGPLLVNFKFSNKAAINIPVGYTFDNHFSLSASAGFYDTDISGIVGNVGSRRQPASVGGDIYFVPLMANAAYTFDLAERLHLSVGAGLGVVYENAGFRKFDDKAAKSITYGQLGSPTIYIGGMKDTSWNFGYQAFAGLSYDITSNAALSVGYHYLQVDSNISINGVNSNGLSGQSLGLGLTWKL